MLFFSLLLLLSLLLSKLLYSGDDNIILLLSHLRPTSGEIAGDRPIRLPKTLLRHLLSLSLRSRTERTSSDLLGGERRRRISDLV
ncbi:hypothetical protein L3X38_008983 [Prunus dulcis]|uniref:Secreted protein n=1 Tax=Prunus dulcis TaxID=3755 RepID=A0AAD5F7M7_PRUDU|nr:hypothetical protein L3X38_008983 [Prunus dulcis]